MFVDVQDAKLFALRHGDRTAQTIIGVGGWIGSSELWSDPFAILSDRWSTIAYDHRGTGVTVSETSSINLGNLVGDVFAVMDAFEVDRAVLAAESAGALTVLSAALARPERISHLVIVDGMYFAQPTQAPSDFERGLAHDYEATLDQFVRGCLAESDAEHLVAWGNKILGRATPEHALSLLAIPRGSDIRRQLSAIVQPTLVIHGRLDVMSPLESAIHLVENIPVADLVIIDDGGHVPTVTRPQLVADAIATFLAEHPDPI
jgi:pimeloyl-ACP methyl ester carboxylesterase